MGKPRKNFKPDEIVYGVCHSDHKRAGKYKAESVNYFSLVHESIPADEIDWSDVESAQSFFVCSTFHRLGLPIPKQNEVHHGTDGSLLFLNSHGIVIRIHENEDGDPRLFLHPHILQPLGWITSAKDHLTIAIYPAAHLFVSSQEKSSIRVAKSLIKSNFEYSDLLTYNNVGYLELEKSHFPIAIDISHRINEKTQNRKRPTSVAFNAARKNSPAFEAMKVLFNHFSCSSFIDSACKEAFDFHQPLRHAFFSAWPNADKNKNEPDPERMKKFWHMAFNYVHHGYKIYGKKWRKSQSQLLSIRQNPVPWKKTRILL